MGLHLEYGITPNKEILCKGKSGVVACVEHLSLDFRQEYTTDKIPVMSGRKEKCVCVCVCVCVCQIHGPLNHMTLCVLQVHHDRVQLCYNVIVAYKQTR